MLWGTLMIVGAFVLVVGRVIWKMDDGMQRDMQNAEDYGLDE